MSGKERDDELRGSDSEGTETSTVNAGPHSKPAPEKEEPSPPLAD